MYMLLCTVYVQMLLAISPESQKLHHSMHTNTGVYIYKGCPQFVLVVHL